MTTAAVIIIGDELLSGKVRDLNAQLVVEELRDRGVALTRLVFVGDGLDEIADEVGRCAQRCDLVITSGGIGPTHDDRTVAGVARAFGVPLVRHGELEAMIRGFWGPRVNDAALRMAEVPAGARLLPGADGLLPIVAMRNIYLLPGVPVLFTAKLVSLRPLLSGPRPALRSLYLRSDETRVAETLARVAVEHPALHIGSYPRLDESDHRLWVTVEGLDPDEVRRATDRLLELLPREDVVRVEG